MTQNRSIKNTKIKIPLLYRLFILKHTKLTKNKVTNLNRNSIRFDHLIPGGNKKGHTYLTLQLKACEKSHHVKLCKKS